MKFLRNFLNYLAYTPKKLVAIVAMGTLAIAPFSTIAQEQVQIEASIQVANVSQNQGNIMYHNQVNAGYDEVVQFQIFYHNMELEDSGKIAQNLRVKVDLPTSPGKTQTIGAVITADNSNTVSDSATVNLSRDDARLEFIPGTVKWRHNAGTNANQNWVTQNLPDSVVTGDGFTVIEDAQPCENFAATITFQARVMVPSLKIEKKISTPGSAAGWQEHINVEPGTKVKYLLTITNNGNTTLRNVGVSDKLPEHVSYVPNTTMLTNSNHPNGVSLSSNQIVAGGVNIGDMGPGSNAHLTFEAIVGEATEGTVCAIGKTLKNVGVASANEVSPRTDDALVSAKVKCEVPPEKPPVTPPAEQLPVTGPEAAVAGLLGSGGMGYAIRTYLRSRKDLTSALLDV